MPCRPRPPLTAREIAAYLCGGRAAKATGYALLTDTELEAMAMGFAADDSPIAASMELATYIRFFVMGYNHRLVVDAIK